MSPTTLKLKAAPLAAIRNRRGEEPIKITASEAKNKLGEVLDNVMRTGMVLITRHETPKAVLLSMEEYAALASDGQSRLDTLSEEFDALLAGMQTTKARAAMKSAFNASPEELAKASVAAASQRPYKRTRNQ